MVFDMKIIMFASEQCSCFEITLELSILSMFPYSYKQHTYRGRKGELTTNYMCACDFNMKFKFACVRWEQSAHEYF